MRRREFITLLGGAAAWPLAARAQQTERAKRIGVLTVSAESDPEWHASLRAFLEQLHELGWEDGRNLQLEYRWAAGDVERMRAFARELVGKSPDILFATSTPTLAVLRPETASIPIVFVQVSDPIGDGFVASFAKPGGNITGLTNFEPSMGGKWLEILKEIAPSVRRVALLFNPDTSPGKGWYYSRPAGLSIYVQISLALRLGASTTGIFHFRWRRSGRKRCALGQDYQRAFSIFRALDRFRARAKTSSARASSVGPTSRPSARAVLRLIASSYLVGACTGKSAEFSPLRMRST